MVLVILAVYIFLSLFTTSGKFKAYTAILIGCVVFWRIVIWGSL